MVCIMVCVEPPPLSRIYSRVTTSWCWGWQSHSWRLCCHGGVLLGVSPLGRQKLQLWHDCRVKRSTGRCGGDFCGKWMFWSNWNLNSSGWWCNLFFLGVVEPYFPKHTAPGLQRLCSKPSGWWWRKQSFSSPFPHGLVRGRFGTAFLKSPWWWLWLCFCLVFCWTWAEMFELVWLKLEWAVPALPVQAEAAGELCAIIFLSSLLSFSLGVDGGWGNSKVPQGPRSVLAEITSTELPGHEHVVFTLPVWIQIVLL